MKRYIFSIILSLVCLAGDALAQSIIINDIHELQITPATVFKLNGSIISQTLFEQVGTGRRANIRVAGDGSGLDGDLLLIDLIDLAIGPISSTDPLAVMQRELTITSDTLLVDVPGDDVGQLQIGDIVYISGRNAENGSGISVTRIEYAPQGPQLWLLFGEVSNSTETLLSIGNQDLLIDAATYNNCDPFPPLAGAQVASSFPAAEPYVANQVLGPVEFLECLDDYGPPVGDIEIYSGPITEIDADKTQIQVQGVLISIVEETLILGGTIDDLALEVTVEVVATIDEFGDATAQSIFIFDGNAPPVGDSYVVLLGPITSINPPAVLMQQFSIAVDAELFGIPGDDFNNLNLGDILMVSASPSDPGGGGVGGPPEASRVELLPSGAPEWLISGLVTQYTEALLSLGTQQLVLGTETLVVCDPVPTIGDHVIAHAPEVSPYSPGDALDPVSVVACDDQVFDPPVGPELVFFDGTISALDEASQIITVEDHQVQVSIGTNIVGGTFSSFVIGLAVEVFGLETDSQTPIDAIEIIILRETVQFVAPLEPDDILPGESIRVLGQVLAMNADTFDPDMIGAGGQPAALQVAITANVTDAGLVATHILSQGPANYDLVSLIGHATNVDSPNLAIGDVLVNTDSSTFTAAGAGVDQAAFFELLALSPNAYVIVQGAQFDAIAGVVSGGNITLDGSQNGPGQKAGTQASKAAHTTASGTGTVTRVSIENVFIGDFEG